MKIVKRKLNLIEVVKKISMVGGVVQHGSHLIVSLNDGWIWPTSFTLNSSNHITCKESELKKVLEWVKEYEKVYQEEYEERPQMTIVYDGGK